MTKVNELGQQILKAKYYAPGETEPEHLFRRVAKVGAIPDAIDLLLDNTKKDEFKTVNSNEYLGYLKEIFGEYDYLADRVICRRVGDGIIRLRLNLVEEAKQRWKEREDVYFSLMENLEFMPATPTLMNAGRSGMLSSCFALRIPDSMEGIFETVKQVAIISKRGGGVGLGLSSLRPVGSLVAQTNGTSSGPISFLKVFNETGNQVQQGGQRRAALLAGLRIDHPDIFDFIKCKDKEGELSNFNVSVFVTDNFMEAVKENKTITLYHEKCPTKKEVLAKDVWDMLVKHAHALGDPGIIFQDKLNKDDVTHGKYGDLLVNPCSELPLRHAGSCNIAALNLTSFYKEFEGKDLKIDINKLIATTGIVVNFLDNVVDLNDYPLKEIEDITLRFRQIGLGTMGLHDLMLKLKIAYGSKESLKLIDTIYGTMKNAATEMSQHLAEIRGIPEELKEFGITRRNESLLTAQPTGTVSFICNQVSSGIEPNFQWEYTRKDSFGEHKIRHFILDEFSGKTLPEYAKTALEIAPEDHVKVQSQIQKHLDLSVSKTVNLPNSATVEDVSKVFMLAYDLGCKSITVYRSGSRKLEVLNKEDKQEHKEVEKTVVTRNRPRVLFGCTIRVNTHLGPCYVTISEDKQGVREVFVHIAKAGSEISSHTETEGRSISTALKYNIPVDVLIHQLKGVRSTPSWDNGRIILSLPDALAKALQEYIDNYEGFSQFIEDPLLTKAEESEHKYENLQEISGDICVECGEPMFKEGGCEVCKSCGYSKCSG